MSEESGSYVWVVVPVGWEYDDNNYHVAGFDIPKSCFTLKEMADQYAQDQNIQRFKEIAVDDHFGGFTNLEAVAYRKAFKNVRRPDSIDIEKALEDFCVEWNINSCYCLDSDKLKSMSEENILALMEELDINFYNVSKVKIHC
jgi:hypothetical protein